MAASGSAKMTHHDLTVLTSKLVIDASTEDWKRKPPKLAALFQKYKDEFDSNFTVNKLRHTMKTIGLPFIEKTRRKQKKGPQPNALGEFKTIDRTARKRLRDVGMLLRAICNDLGIAEQGALDYLDFDDKALFKKEE